jgi:hypothetical protein
MGGDLKHRRPVAADRVAADRVRGHRHRRSVSSRWDGGCPRRGSPPGHSWPLSVRPPSC